MLKRIGAALAVLLVVFLLAACEGGEQPDGGKPYSFIYNNVEITPGGDFGKVRDALGEPASYYEAASCAFDGLDKIYTYGSMQITASESGSEGEKIYSVTLLDDSLATPEGISVGSEKSAVLTAYGEGTDNGSSLVYSGGGTQLVLLIRDGFVTSVQYRYAE